MPAERVFSQGLLVGCRSGGLVSVLSREPGLEPWTWLSRGALMHGALMGVALAAPMLCFGSGSPFLVSGPFERCLCEAVRCTALRVTLRPQWPRDHVFLATSVVAGAMLPVPLPYSDVYLPVRPSHCLTVCLGPHAELQA